MVLSIAFQPESMLKILSLIEIFHSYIDHWLTLYSILVIKLFFKFDLGGKLVEANQEQQFNRGVEDLEMWLAETENQLKSTDLGKVNASNNASSGTNAQ